MGPDTWKRVLSWSLGTAGLSVIQFGVRWPLHKGGRPGNIALSGVRAEGDPKKVGRYLQTCQLSELPVPAPGVIGDC